MRSFNDGFIRAVDALTGNIVWTAPVTTSTVFGDSYYNGMFIQGGLDNNMRAWNATTGELLWTYNPNTFYGQWGTATGVAYGMVYEHKQDTYLYAINATNGELVWKQKGPGLAYSNCLSIAGGKVYCMMGENQYKDPATGQSGYSEYDCFDAYTGELIWSLPLENGAPHNYECIAYGNLYLCLQLRQKMKRILLHVRIRSYREVWCISSSVKDWSMGALTRHTRLKARVQQT
jgi:outer membrane protein assembly factor BamB